MPKAAKKNGWTEARKKKMAANKREYWRQVKAGERPHPSKKAEKVVKKAATKKAAPKKPVKKATSRIAKKVTPKKTNGHITWSDVVAAEQAFEAARIDLRNKLSAFSAQV